MPKKPSTKKTKVTPKAAKSVVITATPAPSPKADTVSQKTLATVPNRALAFLRAAGIVPGIFTALGTRGYTDQEHQEGWELLQAAAGYIKPSARATTADNPVRAAITELAKEGEPMVRVLRAAIEHKFPQFMARLFDGLESTTGPGWILIVSQLLERIDALATAGKNGKLALQLIADRGYPDDERARLAGLVAEAQSLGPAPTPDPTQTDYTEALTALYRWHAEWSQIAKVVIKRRDWLILMGLATRKSRTVPPPAPTAVHGLPAASSPEAAVVNGQSPTQKP